jgi:hypothetical protein
VVTPVRPQCVRGRAEALFGEIRLDRRRLPEQSCLARSGKAPQIDGGRGAKTGQTTQLISVIVTEVNDAGLFIGKRQYWGLLGLVSQVGLLSAV